MSEDVYQRLAKRIDQIPNGFPATESGVERKLLAEMFTPEEAELATTMRLRPEPASEIAGRAGIDAAAALEALHAMAQKGLITRTSTEGEVAFSLRPFVVGFYEAWLPRMDAEFARLVEAYFQETRGGPLGDGLSVHRVIPVDVAIPFEVEVFPYERASDLVEGASSWGVRDCICRVQKSLIGEPCEHPISNCLILGAVEDAFDGSDDIRTVTKEEALDVLREAVEAGLVHSSGNYRRGVHYICNCCTCSCGVLRGIAEFGISNAVAHSSFCAAVDSETCVGCGTCAERCQFGALSVVDGTARIDATRCAGCGLCVTVCPSAALRLERRPEDEIEKPPATIAHWMHERAAARGLSMDDIA
ncbi:MAG: 4Fe-4S binding protein [Candidatus Bipolaricaulota bacterium]|nr:MAG: 4Fe-4S binding protein [Candidatus Bipolaricaulota bacterium]